MTSCPIQKNNILSLRKNCYTCREYQWRDGCCDLVSVDDPKANLSVKLWAIQYMDSQTNMVMQDATNCPGWKSVFSSALGQGS